jgi:3-deoxy-D-manno-octulosonic-acid transferase
LITLICFHRYTVYGQLAYIGGGFGKGIHNILEASACAVPVIFGPKHLKFREAVDLLRMGATFASNNYNELEAIVSSLKGDSEKYQESCLKASEYVKNNKGVTDIILRNIKITSV